jgi:phosphoribosylglycinamide formyltransferase-1
MTGSDDMLRIAVLISGNGTNLQAMIDAIDDGRLHARIVEVISSRPDAYGLKRAAKAHIPTCSLNRDVYADAEVADEVLATELRRSGADYVAMAGYMRMLGPGVLGTFPDRIINLHPALLPSFKGAHAIADAFAAGVKVTGVTVHFANAEYDKGPIIAQRAVPVREDDTVDSLETRIHAVEHILYPEVLEHFAQGDVSIDEQRKVTVRNA